MKTILITGASSGIGRAAANYFAEQGWNVIATMRSPEKETELTKLDCVLVTRLDVTVKETIHQSISQGIERFGKIDVLLNNAGYAVFGLFEAASDHQIKRQFDVNVFGVFQTTQAILPHFRSNQAGTIINVSSIAGRVSFPLLTLYNASKWAIEGFSESLYYELADQNIQVKVIEPGYVNTNFNGRSMDLLANDSLDAYKAYEGTAQQKHIESFQMHQSPPELIAKSIYEATTDQTNQLRYMVGEDCKNMMKARKENTDEHFMQFISDQFR